MLISILVGDMNILPSYLQITLIVILPITGIIIAPVRKKVEEIKIVNKLLTGIITSSILIADYCLLSNQILFISVIQIYFLAVYQKIKNSFVY
jgi:accessory gene regulator B